MSGVDERTRAVVEALADCMPADAFRLDRTGAQNRLWLPRPAGADYSIYVDTYEGGGGLLIGALPNDAASGTFFWHLPLDYRAEDEPEALKVLAGELRRLVLHRSRIIQSAGVFMWRFRCETHEDGEWKPVGGTVACLRLFFVPPLAFARGTLEYHSDPPQLAVQQRPPDHAASHG